MELILAALVALLHGRVLEKSVLRVPGRGLRSNNACTAYIAAKEGPLLVGAHLAARCQRKPRADVDGDALTPRARASMKMFDSTRP